MIRQIFGIGLAVALTTGALLPQTAEACSWAWCGEPADVVPENKGHIPANGALLYKPLASNDVQTDVDALTLVRNDTGAEVDIAVAPSDIPHFNGPSDVFAVKPVAPLEEGISYTLQTANTACEGAESPAPIEVTVVADAEAALPTAFGTISAGKVERKMQTVAEDGGCSHEQDVLITDVSSELDPSLEPWRDVVAFETLVDGEPWRPSHSSGRAFPLGSSWTGRGTDAVFAICNDDPYSEHSWLEPGSHTIQMRAYIPGTDVVLESNTVTVDFVCSDDSATPTGCSSAKGGPSPWLLLFGFFAVARRRG